MISLDDLSEIRHKYSDKKIVLTSGTFDLLHVGHLHYLQEVKSYGDVVVVLLSDDARVKARKGSKRPVIPENDRAELLESLRFVDYVLVDSAENEQFYQKVISNLKPDSYVTDGPDPRFINLVDKSQFIILPRATGGSHASTSAIIDYVMHQ